MFRNPIITGFNPDPSICHADGTYYIVTSTFEYFPGVTIWESKDLINWTYCDSVLKTAGHLDLDKSPDSLGLYAATLRYHGGRFYMVTTNKYLKSNFVVSAGNIHGPWTEPAEICRTGIDPSLFFTEDGRCFYTSNGEIDPYTKSRGIFGAFINPDTGKLLEPLKPISGGCGGNSTEAPHIYFRNGWYHLILAEGGTGMGHHVCALRSREIHGPYESCPFNPVLSHANRKGHDIQCTGHADLLDLGSDKWIAVFLGTRRNTAVPLTTLGRETFMAPVTWTEDNWPVIGQAGHVELIMDDVVPSVQKRSDSIFVDFGKPLSDYPVLKIRIPKDECYIRNAGKSVLTLVGQQELETPLGHPTMLLIRQPEFNCVFTAKLDANSLEGTAGVCAWLQTNYHARLEIRREKNSVVATMYRHVHDFGAVTAEKTLPDVHGEIELSIIASNDSYEFRADGIPVDRISYASLTTGCTCGNCFTGTMFGIFAQRGKATFLKGMSLRTKETT